MKTAFQIFVAASIIVFGVWAWPVAMGETNEAVQVRQLDDLLKDKQATLRQLVEFEKEAYLNGTNGFDAVVRATDQLLATDLEMAENAKTRLTILQERAQLMKSLFSMVEARFKLGQVSRAEVLAAKAAMLESEIRLARELTKDGKPPE